MVRLRNINMVSKPKLAENNLEEATSLPVIWGPGKQGRECLCWRSESRKNLVPLLGTKNHVWSWRWEKQRRQLS